MPTLRAMHADDIDPALALWERTEGMGLGDVDQPAALRRFLERNPGLSMVAEDAGRIVGTALCGYDGRRGYLYHVAVEREHRRTGLGRGLTRACLRALAQLGVTKCHLFVFNANPGGLEFWERSGWIRRGDLSLFSREIAAEGDP